MQQWRLSLAIGHCSTAVEHSTLDAVQLLCYFLQSVALLDPALVNGKRVDFDMVHMTVSIAADVMIFDPTAPCYVRRGLDEASLFSEGTKCSKHVLNGATMIPLVATPFGKPGPSAQGFLQSLDSVARSVLQRDAVAGHA